MTLASFIQHDLANRIEAGQGLPEPLTLDALARHYRVSFTPVRRAVGELVSQRYIEKDEQGRLSVGPLRARGPARADATAPPPNCDHLIAAELIRRSLRGESDYLREEATAERHGVGRTVIRQVFGRLAGQGLLEHVPRCGWRVRRFDEADMRAYLEVREALELKALDLARPRLVRTDLEAMLAGNPAAAPGRHARLDNRLHCYLIEKSGNHYIQDFFARHGVYYTTLFDNAALGAPVVAEMAEQHRAILRPLIDRDWPRARRALVHHIRSQWPIVERLMANLASKEPVILVANPARRRTTSPSGSMPRR